MGDELDHVLIDNGSGIIKAGFAGDDCPRAVFPSVVGRPLQPLSSGPEGIGPSFYVGDEAIERGSQLYLKYPTKHGIVTDWDDMERIWRQAFKELGVEPSERAILLIETSLNLEPNREKKTEIMFETFETPAMSVFSSGPLPLFAAGRVTGTVLESGDGVTQATCITNGGDTTVISHLSEHRSDFAGRDITNYLIETLAERCHYFSTTAEKEIADDIKKKLCYVASDFQEEMAKTLSSVEESYELPDGQIITVQKERFRCTEALFQPSYLGINAHGIHKLVFNAITNSDVGSQDDLYANVILAGGNTMFPGIVDRLLKELVGLAPSKRVRIVAPAERKYSTWIGGSIFGSLSSFQPMLITKQEYAEHGPSILHTKSVAFYGTLGCRLE